MDVRFGISVEINRGLKTVNKKEKDELLLVVDDSRKAVVDNPRNPDTWTTLGFSLYKLE